MYIIDALIVPAFKIALSTHIILVLSDKDSLPVMSVNTPNPNDIYILVGLRAHIIVGTISPLFVLFCDGD
jgi:hypothetical protein